MTGIPGMTWTCVEVAVEQVLARSGETYRYRTTDCGTVRTGVVRVARLADFLGLRPRDTGDTHVTVMTS
jgi:hypothetical protein